MLFQHCCTDDIQKYTSCPPSLCMPRRHISFNCDKFLFLSAMTSLTKFLSVSFRGHIVIASWYVSLHCLSLGDMLFLKDHIMIAAALLDPWFTQLLVHVPLILQLDVWNYFLVCQPASAILLLYSQSGSKILSLKCFLNQIILPAARIHCCHTISCLITFSLVLNLKPEPGCYHQLHLFANYENSLFISHIQSKP